jgi:HD-GYP domain-containing protein (c-di-GMP phosphodiesterase class II)
MSTDNNKALPKNVAANPKVQLLGRSLVVQLHSVLRTMRIHDPSNKALLVNTEKLKDTINTLWAALSGPVRVQFVDDIVYLNDARLRIDGSVKEQIDTMREEFAKRGLGGLAFTRPVDTTALRDFLVIFTQQEQNDEGLTQLRRSLEDMKELALELLGPQTFKAEDQRAEALKVDRKTFALQTYAKSIVAVREFVSALKQGKDPMQQGKLHITRIVQDLVDIATERVNFLIKLSSIKQAQEYAYNHAANTCVLSIVIGKSMEIDRLALVDLGTSALLANVAYAMLPPEMTEQAAQLTLDQRHVLHDAMVRQIRSIIGQGKMLSDSMIRRIIVAYEQHLPYTNPETRQKGGTHVFSRIVQVASAFDALTTRRPWREGFTADEALRILMREADTQFDPMIVRILVNMMGMFPLGTGVVLDSGEVAIVYHNSNDPRMFEKPWVKVVRDESGAVVRRTIIRKLAEHTGRGGTIVSVATMQDLADIDAASAIIF